MSSRKSETLFHEFDFIPATNQYLLTVQAGIESHFALAQAESIDDAVKLLLLKGVESQSMDAEVIWLCYWAIGAAQAYRSAAGAVA